jgi:hypothetical protein
LKIQVQNKFGRGIPRGKPASGNLVRFAKCGFDNTAIRDGWEFVLRNVTPTPHPSARWGVRFAKWCLSATLIRTVIEVRFAKWCIGVTPIRYGNPNDASHDRRRNAFRFFA